jgi:hypothetical protein
MEQSSSASLCLQLEPTRRCLHENDVIARGELKRLPNAGGQGDPSSGLDSRGSLHRLGLTGLSWASRDAGHIHSNGVDSGDFILLSGTSETSDLHGPAQKSQRPRPLLARAACGRGLAAATHPRHGLRVPWVRPVVRPVVAGDAATLAGAHGISVTKNGARSRLFGRSWHCLAPGSTGTPRGMATYALAAAIGYRRAPTQLRPWLGGCRGCRRLLRHHGPSRLDRIGSPVPVPSLQGHRRQNALR